MPVKPRCQECCGDHLLRRAITPWLFCLTCLTCLTCAHVWQATRSSLEKQPTTSWLARAGLRVLAAR